MSCWKIILPKLKYVGGCFVLRDNHVLLTRIREFVFVLFFFLRKKYQVSPQIILVLSSFLAWNGNQKKWFKERVLLYLKTFKSAEAQNDNNRYEKVAHNIAITIRAGFSLKTLPQLTRVLNFKVLRIVCWGGGYLDIKNINYRGILIAVLL